MRRALLAAAIAALTLPATASASFTQEPGSPFDVGLHPIGIYGADFNGDARPDLFTINESTVSLLLRGAGGGYALAGPSTTVGAGPSGAAIANFGGDARPDAVVANFVDQNLTILITGAAGAPATIALGFRPGAIAAGDFTGNAAIDLAVSDWDGNTVRIVPGAGNGTFAAAGSPISTGVNPRRIAVADFNADGAADLAITNAGGSSVTVLLRSGAGFAPEGTAIGVGGQPQGIIARDFNGDGRPDLALAEYATDSFRLLLRQPGGGFVNAPGSPVKVGDGPVAIASGDFNRDGLPDVVTANQAASTASVRLRTAAGFVGDATPEAGDGHRCERGDGGRRERRRPVRPCSRELHRQQRVALAEQHTASASAPAADLDMDTDGVKIPRDCDDNNPAIRPGAKDKPKRRDRPELRRQGRAPIRGSRGRSRHSRRPTRGRLQHVHIARRSSPCARATGSGSRCNGKRRAARYQARRSASRRTRKLSLLQVP